MEISIRKTSCPKKKPDQNNLGFGQYFTDHMFVMDYSEGAGWHSPRIIPNEPMLFDPATMVFHYGQATFEGLKAYKSKDNRVLLFRPDKNFERMNISNERLCIPALDEKFVLEALKELIRLDRDWIPQLEGTSLYIRPFVIATDPFLGLRPSLTYRYMVIASPVGNYYPQGFNPVKIYVENNYVRAVRGGLGYAKTPANYAAGLKSQEEAKIKKYAQVLWLDGIERKYIEEVGAMNIFFKLKQKVITPSLEGTILAGITRASVITLLRDWGMNVQERKITIQEIDEAYEHNELEEAFGTGTAAVISPIGELCWNNKRMIIQQRKTGALSRKLYDTILGIQNGRIPDKFDWMHEVR